MLNTKNIFVIEDNSFYQKLIKTILIKSDSNVFCFNGTEDILEHLTLHSPFLLIVDMHLTNNIQGLNIIKLVKSREEYKNIAIIAISAHMNKIKQVQLENLSCYVLNKPIEIDSLVALVQKIKDSFENAEL